MFYMNIDIHSNFSLIMLKELDELRNGHFGVSDRKRRLNLWTKSFRVHNSKTLSVNRRKTLQNLTVYRYCKQFHLRKVFAWLVTYIGKNKQLCIVI